MTNCMEDALKEAGVVPPKPPKRVRVTLINESATEVVKQLAGGMMGCEARIRVSESQTGKIDIHLIDQPGHVITLDHRGMWHLKTMVTL